MLEYDMNYVCPVCNSPDWEPNGKMAECISCGNSSKLELMKKVVPDRARNLNEIMPDSTTRNQKTIQIND